MRSMILAAFLLSLGCGAEMGSPSFMDGDVGRSTPGNDLASEPTAAEPLVQPRKIIYEAELSLIVDDFAAVEQQIPELVKQYGGYLAEATAHRRKGARLSGNWTARIPVEQYHDFMAAAAQLGIPERRTELAQDVTEQYLDLEAQIANKKVLEERIRSLLEKPGELKDLIEVERELSRVRGEVEQLEGRLKYLQNRTSFTTVRITAVEQRGYIPPQAPTFPGQVANTLRASLDALLRFAQGAAIVAVAVIPWLLVAGAALWVTLAFVRLLVRIRR